MTLWLSIILAENFAGLDAKRFDPRDEEVTRAHNFACAFSPLFSDPNVKALPSHVWVQLTQGHALFQRNKNQSGINHALFTVDLSIGE